MNETGNRCHDVIIHYWLEIAVHGTARAEKLVYSVRLTASQDKYYLPPTKEEVYAIAHDVCLSVSKITQKRMDGFVMKFCASVGVKTWTN